MDWYPWYFLIYKADTMHLNPYQDGCYRRLIDHYMETRQPLPDNEAALARIIGDSEANWVAMGSAIVRPFFSIRSGKLHLKRCDNLLKKQDEGTKVLSESGKKGADKRWGKNKDIDSHPIASPSRGYSRGEDKDKKEEAYASSPPTPKAKKTNDDLPEWVPVKEFLDYAEFRKSIKAPLTPRAKELAVKELDKLRKQGHNPADILNQSIFRGWKGLFPLKGDDRNEQNRNHQDRSNTAANRWRGPADALTDGFAKALAIIEIQEQRGSERVLDPSDESDDGSSD